MQLTVDSGQLPEGWEIKKLGEIYDVRDGTHDLPKYLPEGYALITSKNLKNNGLSFKNVNYISEVDYKKINERSAVHKGDILLAMIGTIGNPIVVEVEPEFAIKNVALIKVPRNQSSYFLKYYLETEYVQSKMQREAKGTTQKFVGLGYLRDFPIILPPPSEQKRIVAILDEAFEGIDRAIANTEKNLTNSRELFQYILKSQFSSIKNDWITTTIGKQITLQRGFDITKKQQNSGNIPVISSGGIKSFHDDIAMAQAPGVVIGRKGTLGKVFYLDKDFWPHDTTLWVKDFNKNYPKFVYYFFQALDVIKLDTGTANPALNRNLIHPIEVNWPPISQQEEITKKLDFSFAATQASKPSTAKKSPHSKNSNNRSCKKHSLANSPQIPQKLLNRKWQHER